MKAMSDPSLICAFKSYYWSSGSYTYRAEAKELCKSPESILLLNDISIKIPNPSLPLFPPKKLS